MLWWSDLKNTWGERVKLRSGTIYFFSRFSIDI